MLNFQISERLEKKLRILGKKDKVLALIFRKKVDEILSHNGESINTYKNLKAPMNELKRIHLTNNYILLFKFVVEEKSVIFIDILHWDKAYKQND
jgi:mRNA-degrading endonuclease RelE of RelBE toxin-antitoxin system